MLCIMNKLFSIGDNFLKKNHYLPGSPIILKIQPNVNDATIIKIIS